MSSPLFNVWLLCCLCLFVYLCLDILMIFSLLQWISTITKCLLWERSVEKPLSVNITDTLKVQLHARSGVFDHIKQLSSWILFSCQSWAWQINLDLEKRSLTFAGAPLYSPEYLTEMSRESMRKVFEFVLELIKCLTEGKIHTHLIWYLFSTAPHIHQNFKMALHWLYT